MKLVKILLVLFIMASFSACEVQGNVVDIVDGTPSNADTVLPHKFKKSQESDSVKEAREANLRPEFIK